MHLLWDPRTWLILIQPPSRQDRHRRLEFASTQQPSLLSPLANPFRKDCVGASAVTMQAISLPLSLMQHVTLELVSYMAIGTCWDRWGRLYTYRRRRRLALCCLRTSRPSASSAMRKRWRAFCNNRPSSSSVAAAAASWPSSVWRRPSNEFGNFIY